MRTLLTTLLASETETEVLEFKEAKNQYDKDKLGKYFSALSNEANLRGKDFAYLVFGVDRHKNIVGTTISDNQINEYKKEMTDHTSPARSFADVQRMPTEHGPAIIFKIPPAPSGTPVAWKGHWYGRDGESLGALSEYELDLIKSQNILEDWSIGIVSGASVADLSAEAIDRAKELFIIKNPKLKHEILDWDNSTFLNKAKICVNGEITRAAILLLGKPDADHFLSPATATITWILKDSNNLEKDYTHFTCPLLLSIEQVQAKIRNLKYRYIREESLFPEEVDQYDPYIIREALNNCIAHQDYPLGGKILVVEREDGILIFLNAGSFIPGSVERVIQADAPEPKYRNPFLINAMVNLNMIDTIGSGIKRMFLIQRRKYFPLPDYDIANDQVKVKITGKVVDLNYARKLASLKDLSLSEIMLLDKVAKKKALSRSEMKELRQKNLIEGRKPNFHISSSVAKATGQKSSYIKQRGIEDQYAKKIIVDYVKEFAPASRQDIETFLFEKLPDILDVSQKSHKVKNLLQKLRYEKKLQLNADRKWILDEL
ncbi:MAG: putative DNA binding domain-containing protein [Saprospiraceae bacterium]|nr:putative DNA binding domain-containing protein [Saprospiraceae bacterium]